MRLKSTLGRPSVRALIGTLVGSAPGLVLPFAIASRFGIGRSTDAYVYAFSLTLFGLTICVSVLEPNTLAVAESYRTQGRAALLGFARSTAARAAAGVVALDVPIVAVGVVLVASRAWPSADINLAIEALIVLLGLVATAAVSSVFAGCLYSIGGFFLPTLTQAFRSVLPLLALYALPTNRSTLVAIAASASVGEALRSTLLYRALRKASTRLPDGPVVYPRSIWRTIGPAAISILALAINPVVDRAVASTLSPGSVTLLDLGEKLFYLPVTVVQGSIVLVAGSRWSALLARSDRSLRQDFRRTVMRTILISTALAAAGIMCVLSVHFVLSSFGGVPVGRITPILLLFLAGLPGQSVLLLASRMVTVSRQTQLLPIFAATAVIINTAGDIAGAAALGVSGIALSSAVVATFNAAMGVLLCRWLMRHHAT